MPKEAKYFVVHEWSAVKNSFSTYVWSKVDSCFAGQCTLKGPKRRFVVVVGVEEKMFANKKKFVNVNCSKLYRNM